MFNKKRDQIFLFYIVFSDGLKLYKGCTHIPIGLLSIGTFLQERNYQIKLICDRYPDMDEIKRAISYSRVRVAGFYTSTDNIYRVIEISKFIKQNFPGIIIIFGGPHATVRPVEVLEGSPADIVVRYEGEYTMLDLMNYFFLDEGKLENIPGIVYRDGNSIKSNPLRPCIDNLDELPIINRDLAPTREGVVSILTGRGCPYECTFCFQATGHYHRMRSIEHVLKELDEVLNTYDDPLYLGFIDDTFIAHPERTIKLCREIKKRKDFRSRFYWYAEGRANIIYHNPELIKEMKEAGMKVMQIGIESANKKSLALYKKMITPEQIEFTIQKCVEEEIFQIVTTFIIGGPFESRKTIEESIDFAKKLIRLAPGRLSLLYGFLTPFPGTSIGDEPEKYGIIPISPYLLIGGNSGMDILAETVNLKINELLEMKELFYKEVTNTQREVLMKIPKNQVEQIFSLVDEGIQTLWYDIMNDNIALKRYFNFRKHSLYKTFYELTKEELDEYFPQRTDYRFQIASEGLILERFGEQYCFNAFEQRVFYLSAGKIKFKDIVKIMAEEFKDFASYEEIAMAIMKFYKQLDNIYGIVFGKI